MRSILLASAMACLVTVALPQRTAAAATDGPTIAAAQVVALQIPDKKIEITVGDHGVSAAWYRNPVWIAIGLLAAIVIILLIVMLARGGGTTIVRE